MEHTTVGDPTDRSPIVNTTDGGVTTRLMVLGLANSNGRVVGSELYRVAQECAIPVEAVRSCLRRLTREGLFEREGEGREAVFDGHLFCGTIFSMKLKPQTMTKVMHM